MSLQAFGSDEGVFEEITQFVGKTDPLQPREGSAYDLGRETPYVGVPNFGGYRGG